MIKYREQKMENKDEIKMRMTICPSIQGEMAIQYKKYINEVKIERKMTHFEQLIIKTKYIVKMKLCRGKSVNEIQINKI